MMTVERAIEILSGLNPKATLVVYGRVKSMVATDEHTVDAEVRHIDVPEEEDIIIINI